MKRDGSAETGVSIFMLLPWCGCGRAKGLGGPVAPADRAPAEMGGWVVEGDGGGRTTPEECESSRLEFCDVASLAVAVVPRGEPESLVALPASDSSGICTFKRGREMLPTRRLLDREGGVKVVSGMVPKDPFRLTCDCICVLIRWRDGGEFGLLPLDTLPTSIDCDLPGVSDFGGSGLKAARCCDRIDRFSSMGVKMLPPLRGACLILVSRSGGWRGRSTSSGFTLGSG